MSTTTNTIVTLRLRGDGVDKVKESVKEFQEYSKSSFEKNVEEIQEELKDKDVDQLNDYINEKFDDLNQGFINYSNITREYVRSLAPKRSDYLSEEDFKKAKEEYQNFIAWVTGVIQKLSEWLKDLFEKILSFFKSLWNWIKAQVQNVAKNVKEFVKTVSKMIKNLYDFLFN
ncbi:unnamed protein product [Rhizophagus irregularis]|uniref:Uncharacterized protein n=1 Tax=Rhizophagus irregularis TaxID=588596 RepID=A0A916EA79_9GLOM|nr:unnamed protein product [Rhizophagus irregularis]